MARLVEIEVTQRYLVPEPPVIELSAEDGEPLESPWHRAQINLLIECVHRHLQDRHDYFVGGNMFLYYSAQQARSRDYKGPDFFFVCPTDGRRIRESWIVWEEDGQYPNLIIELLSRTTAAADLGPKKDLYERTFKTPEYFCFDPETGHLRGWRLGEDGYTELSPDEAGRFESRQLGLFLGTARGTYQRMEALWLRWFERSGAMVPTAEERAAGLRG